MSQDHVARTDWKTFRQLAPDAYDSVLALNKIAEQNGLDKQLLELVKLRASQIYGFGSNRADQTLVLISSAVCVAVSLILHLSGRQVLGGLEE